MTDFATLVLGANTSGLLRAKTDLAAVTSAGAKTEAGIKKSMAGIEGAVKTVPMAAKEAAAGMNSLRLSLDPLYASSKQYEAAQKQVTAAVKLGATSQAEANRIMKLAEAKYLGIGNAAQMAARQMGGNGGFAHQSRMAAMQLSQVAQQTAATGDFVRALAIQLPDLALGFGAVGIGIGVVAGALLPMAANLVTGRDNAEELENAMDSLSQASYDYTSAADQAKMSVAELALEFGSAAEEAKRAFEFMQGVNLGKALDQLTVALGTMDFSELERFANIIKEGPAELEVLNDTYNKALAGLQEQFGATGEQALKLRDHLNEIRTAKGPEEIVQTVDRLNQYLIASFGSAQDIPPELREMVQRLLEAQTAAARITARLDGSADSANTAANAASNLSGQLSVAAQYAAQLAANLAMAPAGIQGFQNKAEQLTAQIAALDAGLGKITASAAGYRKELEQKYGLADAANEAEANYISGVINRQVKEYTNVQNLNEAYTDRITAINKAESAATSASKKSASAAKKAMKDAAREAEKFAKEVEQLEFDADPLKKYNAELKHLNKLVDHGLSDGAYAHAVKDLNEEFISSYPNISKIGDAIGDFVVGGMRDFKSLLKSFKNMLAEMIATAISNPIKLALIGGMSGGGLAGGAAAGVPGTPGGGGVLGTLTGGVGGGGGLLGGLLGTWGSGTGLIGGLGSVVSSFGMSGFGGAMSSIGHAIGGATAGLGGLATAIGAIAAPLLAVAAVFSFFRKKTKLLDAGLRITLDGMGVAIEEFRKIETSRFWGLSKSRRTTYTTADEDVAAPLRKIIGDLQDSIIGAADVLGIGTEAFNDFSHQLEISTKGMSDEEAIKAIEAEINELGDAFASMVPGLEEVTREGEGAATALQRLSTSLTGANDALDLLGHAMFDASNIGADAASHLADAFGGLDAMASATNAYFAGFYSAEERYETVLRRLQEQFVELGQVMPQSRNAFREMIEEIDLSTESGRELYAALMSMSGALNEVLPQISMFTEAMMGIVSNINGEIGDLIADSQQLAQEHAQAAQLWYRTATTLRGFLSDLLNTNLTAASDAQVLGRNQMLFNQAMAAALDGDAGAAADIPGLARDLLTGLRANSATELEYRRAASQIQQQVQLAAGVAELEGANEDVLETLYNHQIEVLESLANFLQLEGLTGADLEGFSDEVVALVEDWDGTMAQFDSSIASLEQAIRDAEDFSYSQLQERLNVSVDVLADADIPAYLSELIENAEQGITGYIDFVLRSDLTAPDKWLAVNAASEHVKTIEFLAESDLTHGQMALALNASSELRRSIRFLVLSDIDAETRSIALAGSSELSRVVNVALNETASDPRALRLALQNIGGYAVLVTATLTSAVPPRVRDMILRGTGSYAAMIEAALTNLSGPAQRILLSQQGQYLVDMRGVLNSSVTGQMRWMMLNNLTTGIRRVTIDTVWGPNVSDADQRLIDIITGNINGSVTLGGQFSFTASRLFSTWYEGSTRNLITTPMEQLRGHLNELRVAVRDDIAARQQEAARRREIANLNQWAANVMDRMSGGDNIIAQVRALEAETGVTLQSSSGNAAQFWLDEQGRVQHNAAWAEYGAGDDINAFRRGFWANGGLEDQIGTTNRNIQQAMAQLEIIRGRLTGLGSVPQFATGGSHYGGLRIVGENGPELEATGPSRIYNAQQTRQMLSGGDNAVQRELLAEIKAFREEQRQLGVRSDKHEKRTADILRKWEAIGPPAERTA